MQPKPTSTPVKEDSPKPISTTEIEIPNEIPIREATPDIIRKSPVKEAAAPAAPISAPITAPSEIPAAPENTELNGGDSLEETPSKKIIQSEEEAKARLAEKRREMKEKMEREAELERQRQLEAERLEAERKVRVNTVWKIANFSASQILREIKVGEPGASKIKYHF